MGLFQYQELARPIDATAAGTPDTSTDWYQQAEDRPTRPRQNLFYLPLTFIAAPIVAGTDPVQVNIPFTVSRDVKDVDPRSRKMIQQVSSMINSLLISGELVGTVKDTRLGYVPANTDHWGTVAPEDLKDALDRIAAALAGIGATP